jgi:hypothetical protein
LDQIADLALIVDDQNVTVVVLAGQLRLPFVAVRPAPPIDGEVFRAGLSGSPIHMVTNSYTKALA